MGAPLDTNAEHSVRTSFATSLVDPVSQETMCRQPEMCHRWQTFCVMTLG